MEIKQLKIFIAIAKGQSFTSVADNFGMTKSSVSYAINNIEKEVGVDLLIRAQNVTTLTEYGCMFLNIAKKTVSVFEHGMEEINNLKGTITGDLRVGIGSFIEPFLRKACAKLLKEHPSLSIDAHFYRANTLNQLLKAGKLDVAFTLNKAYEDEGIVSVPCIPIQIMALMRKTHNLAGKKTVAFDELCNYDCIMPSEDKRSLSTINKYIDADLSLLRMRVNINNTDAALNMIEEDNYITFGTKQLILNRPNLVAIPIKGLEMNIMSNMHYLKDVSPKKSVTKLKEALEEYAIPLLGMMDV